MAKKMLIDATHAEETRVVVVDGNQLEDFDFESLNRRQLAGNIYLAKVMRVEPSLQAAFIDYGGNRHGFLAFNEIHADYYQIPAADREAMLAEEEAYERALQDAEKRLESLREAGSEAGNAALTIADEVLTSDEAPYEDLDPETGLIPVPEENADAVPEEADADADAPLEAIDAENETPSEGPEPEGDDPSEPDQMDGVVAPIDETLDPIGEEDALVDTPEFPAGDEIELPRKPRQRKYKIQEVIKPRQIMLVQVVKEERGNKGAALTTYLSLAGRYCVLMPNTARGGGISRKITNLSDRKKLKSTAAEFEVPKGAGLIIRTAGAKRTKPEIKRDYEYLIRQWDQIRDLTMNSVAPTQIYAEGDLIKRSIRDLYGKDIDEILVEGDTGYERAHDYMKMLMPSHAKNVKQYRQTLPLFSRYQVEKTLSGMFNPTVQLKSGGYIVIGVTEALVAIDVNSGRSTKEGSIEETALKTNLEAADEIARQLRLRDLAGLVVIDFIDMEERKNNASVERQMKDALRSDRARIQIGRISGFGLMEMSRQRLRPGIMEATTTPCPHCHGTGNLRSNDNQALAILRDIEEEAIRQRSKEVLIRVPVDIANYMHNAKREHIANIEARFGLSVRIEADFTLSGTVYEFERLKTATRVVDQPSDLQIVSLETIDTQDLDEPMPTEEAEPRKKKSRRRRGRKSANSDAQAAEQTAAQAPGQTPDAETEAPSEDAAPEEKSDLSSEASEAPQSDEKPKKSRRRAPRKKKAASEEGEAPAISEGESDAFPETSASSPDAEEEKKPARKPRRKATKKDEKPEDEAATPKATKKPASKAEPADQAEAVEKPRAPESKSEEAPTSDADVSSEQPAKKRRTGWWSRG